MSKRQRKKTRAQTHSSFSSEYYVGIIAALIILFLSIYSCRDLFTANSQNSLARFFLYGFLTSLAVVSAFWYCVNAKRFRYNRHLLYGVFVSIGIYYLMTVTSAWYIGGDSGKYITLTKSLASFQGFTNLHLSTYNPEVKFGFGLPLLLVPVYWLFGINITAMNTLVAFVSLGFLVALYYVVRKDLNDYLLILLLLALGVNFWMTMYASVVMTEPPFFLFFTLTILAVYRYEKDKTVWTLWLFCVIALAYMAYQIRPIAVSLFPTIVLYFAFKRNWKKAGIIAVSLFSLFVLWNVRNYLVKGGFGYFSQFLERSVTESATTFYVEEEGLGFLGNVFWKPFRNLYSSYKFLTPMVYSLPQTKWFILQMATLVVGYIGLLWHTWKKRTFYDFSIIIIFIGISIYGSVMYPFRYWLPLVPFVMFYIVMGWDVIVRFATEKTKNFWVSSFSKLLCVTSIGLIFSLGLRNSDSFVQKTHPSRNYTPTGKAYVEAAKWVKNNTPPDAHVASRLGAEFYSISDRKGSGSRVWGYQYQEEFTNSKENQQEVLSRIRDKILQNNVDYWILDNTREDSQIVIRVLIENPEKTDEMFQIVYAYPPQQEGANAYVLKVNKDWVAAEKTKGINK